MSWDEIRTRIGQETRKRLDLIGYYSGQDFAPISPPNASTGKFFFSEEESSARIALLKDVLPDQVDLILAEANAICLHRFTLLGYDNLEYGREIDWHLDAVHGKRAPRRPWHTLDFLDFDSVGDHKVIWELNRHQHLVTLAKAWRISREQRFIAEIVEQWNSWQRANPYPLGINWGSALEVAFRSLSWLWVAHLLGESAPPDFRRNLTSCLGIHGRYIEKYLSTYFSPNTHLLGEAVALFFIGTLCPAFPRSEAWQRRGWEIILRQAQRQVRSDGVYFEQSLHYHVYALDFFLHARVLAERNGIEIPPEFDAVMEKMLMVVEALSQAGSTEGFGDDDGGRVFNPRRNRTEQMNDPLALGAAIYGCEKIRAAAKLTEEAVWLFGERATGFGKGSNQRKVQSRAFELGGIYVIAANFQRPQLMMIDAGPQGTGRSGHGHADALSIRLIVEGQRYLVDAGTGVYISDNGDREMFRGTGAHNTLRVDGQDQAVPAGPFAWTNLPAVKAEKWIKGEGFDFLVASHDGYNRLPQPVIHRRFVFHCDGMWLVRDVAEGEGNHLLEIFWHFGENIEVTEEKSGFVGRPLQSADDRSVARLNLALLTPCNSIFKHESGSGLISPAYGKSVPAPALRFSAQSALPAECAVLMKVQQQSAVEGRLTEVSQSQHNGLHAYAYETADAVDTFFFQSSAEIWSSGPCTSDAEFLYSRVEHNRPTKLVMIGGSFVKWDGKELITQSKRTDFSWSTEAAELKSSSPDDAFANAGRRF